jgi:tetratricopeptide (TPR) repeat protein
MRPDSEAARNTRRDAYAGLAAVAENRRQWEQARDHLQEWLKQDDKSVPANQRLGRALYMAGHKDEALHALTRAHELDPNADAPLVSMAQLAAQNGDAVAAGDFLERAVKADPKSVKVRVAQARWLIDAEKVDAAKAVIAEAKKIDPASKDVERLNGLIAWNQRDFASAEKIFEALHKEVPSDLGVSNLLALSLAEQEDSAKRARALQIAEANV